MDNLENAFVFLVICVFVFQEASMMLDDDPLGEVVADDEDAEFINRVCETEILTNDNLLAKLT